VRRLSHKFLSDAVLLLYAVDLDAYGTVSNFFETFFERDTCTSDSKVLLDDTSTYDLGHAYHAILNLNKFESTGDALLPPPRKYFFFRGGGRVPS
jgi:hypothetical protein